MDDLLIKVLNMSISASWLILVVLTIRLIIKKAPKWISCMLWGFVGVRLLVPYSIQSTFSFLPTIQTINIPAADQPAAPIITSGFTTIDQAVNPVIHDITRMGVMTPEKNGILTLHGFDLVFFIWITGICFMLLYAIISYVHVKNSVSASVKVSKNVYICDELQTPFILGIVCPKIYLPSHMDPTVREVVIQHEKAHLKRGDNIWKPLGFFLLAVYWFHPLCWVAYILFCRDIEMACDEKAIKNMERNEKALYSEALLSCSLHRKKITACPLAFGEVGVRERVKGIINYKKPAFWMIIAAILLCIIVAVCFLTDPKNPKEGKYNKSNTVNNSVISENDTDKTADMVKITVPTIDLSMESGADGSILYYADTRNMIFGGYYGLFVYDREEHSILRSLDLRPIGCNATQGDSYCEIQVSEDGSSVYFHPIDRDDLYVYNIMDNTLRKEKYETYDFSSISFFKGQSEDGISVTYYEKSQNSADAYPHICRLVNSFKTLGELGVYDSKEERVYPLFTKEEYQGARLWSKKDIYDIVKAEMIFDGVDYICTDKPIFTYIEETGVENATKIKGGSGCPFDDVMYLTRADGSVGMILPATDSCNVVLLADGYFDFGKEMNKNVFETVIEEAKNHEADETIISPELFNVVR